MERKFMKKKTVFNIAFSAMMIALAICFDLLGKFVIVLQMPNGGGVSLTMLPLIMITIICNYKYGLVSGAAFGVINCFLIDGYSFNLVSFILDYIIAFSGLAIIGIFAKQIKENPNKSKRYFILGVVLGLVIRLIASGFSGVINAGIWGYDAEFLSGVFESLNISVNNDNYMIYLYIYSFLIYNLPYIAISGVISIIIGIFTYPKLLAFIEIDKDNK